MRRLPSILAAALACLMLAAPLHAEITPHAGEGDPHIQTVEFDPAQVVGLHVAGGYAVTVVFGPDERIETVTLGDSAGWQVTVDHRAVRPLAARNGRWRAPPRRRSRR